MEFQRSFGASSVCCVLFCKSVFSDLWLNPNDGLRVTKLNPLSVPVHHFGFPRFISVRFS